MMKQKVLKTVLYSIFTLFSLFLTAQGAPPSDGVFRLQNVETGEFLSTAGGSSQPVTMSTTGDAQSTHWTFVESGAYYNIDSESESGGTGILRAPGAGGPGGPFVVVSTLKAPPATDTDKTWTIYYNVTNDTYRFESRTAGRFLYQEVDGTVTHTPVPDTDDRSNWKLIPLVQIPVGETLSFQNVETGEFLTTAGGSSQPVTMSATREAQNTNWALVESGTYYNIDSESEIGGTGILRAPGAGGPGGPYVVVSTLKAPPAADTDKTWTIHYNANSDTYRFESRTAGRFLYQEVNGTVTHTPAPNTDDRSNWKLIPFVQNPDGAAPDEDTNPDLSCPASGEFQNDETRNVDIPNAVNVGTADDRTCYSDYSEVDLYGNTWGVYNITAGSNHWDAPNTLQPRIERSLPRSQETGVGSYARFTGTLRILEVGNTTGTNNDGTYLMQAKGKHTGGGGPADPAICLYLAMPVYDDDGNGNQVQVSFDIVREQINYRGGSGADGRSIVFLKNVAKNEIVDIELEVGFRADPDDPNLKIHYSDAVIGGEAFNWNIPDPERGLESGIRYGVYRVKGGRGQMRWANTTYEKVEIVDSDPAPADIVRLRNVETGEFLTTAGGSTQPVTMSISGGPQNTHWTFVESGPYYNIDSESQTGGTGILRAPGAGGPGGPYVIISTLKAPPAADTDKTWTVHYDEVSDTYRFESRTAGRYLYHNEDGTVTHSPAPETDNRSVWEAIPLGEPLEAELVSTDVSCAGADDGMVSVSVTGGIAPYTYLWSSSETTATIGNLAAGTYLVTISDAVNETITASTEISAPSAIVVTVSDNVVLYTGYDGAEQCASIGVTAVTGGEAPYQFNWSTGDITQDIYACPNITQVYTVTVTDADGCETTEEITIDVIDVGCGIDQNTKVQICHKGKTICVAQEAVQAHLDHGDTLGDCEENLANEKVSVRTYPNEDVSVITYPNPFTSLINAKIEVKTKSTVKLLLSNLTGKIVAEKTQQVSKGIETIHFPLNALPFGTYYLQVHVENQVYVTEIFIKI